MNKPRKFAQSTALAAVAALTLTACASVSPGSGDSNGQDTKPDSLELWLPPTMADNSGSDVEIWDDLLKPWEDENGVDVNVTIVSWASYEAKMLTGMSSGTGPDVTYMYNEMVADYVARDQLLPLDEHLTDEDKANFLYLDKGQIDGQQFMMPYIVGGARVLYFNQAVLDSAGVTEPPATWDDFLEAARAIKAAGGTPFLQQWGDPNRSMMNSIFYPFLWQAGADLFNEDGTATAFNSPEGVRAAELLYSMKEEGLMPDAVTGLNEAQVRDEFKAGNVGFIIDSDATMPQFTEAGIDLGTVGSLEDAEQGTFIAVDSLVVPANCDAEDLCVSLLRHILSGEVMKAVHEYAPFNPVAKDEDYAGQPEFQELYEQAEVLHSPPVVQNSVQVYNILYKHLQQMMLGQKSPEEALADAESEGNAVLAKN